MLLQICIFYVPKYIYLILVFTFFINGYNPVIKEWHIDNLELLLLNEIFLFFINGILIIIMYTYNFISSIL